MTVFLPGSIMLPGFLAIFIKNCAIIYIYILNKKLYSKISTINRKLRKT